MTTTSPLGGRRNKYAAPCILCGTQVPAGSGALNKNPTTGKWIVTHDHGDCQTAAVTATMAFTPTAEQDDALAIYRTGESMVIEACAGAGKTSTLLLLANADPAKRVQYTAFNRKIVDEVGAKLPANATAKTVHQLAYAGIGNRYSARMKSRGRTSQDRIASILHIDPIYVGDGDARRALAPGFLAGQVMRALNRFCQSADKQPAVTHFAPIDGVDTIRDDGTRSYDTSNMIARTLLPHLEAAWADMLNVDGVLPFGHAYIKIWELNDPKINADVIMFDEAQDASPVLASIVAQQTHAQRIYVGDSCQPPGTMVQVVVGESTGSDYRTGPRHIIEERPIEQLKVGDQVVSYDIAKSHLHRAGRTVLGITRRPFAGELITAKVDGQSSRYTPDHRCVVKIDDAFHGRHVVYMMGRQGQYRVGRATGRYGSGPGADFGPATRARAENADELWLLGAYDSAQEANLAEASLAWSFGVPTLTFTASNVSTFLDGPHLDRFWTGLGPNRDAAAALLAALGRDIQFPLWRAGEASLLIRRATVIRACNLMDGMRMLPASDDARAYGKSLGRSWWAPIDISREAYRGEVYSMDVADHHTYVADGIVTHNCQAIYGFTGAIDAIAKMKAEGLATATLSQSFRFGPAIAARANLFLDSLDADLRVVGTETIPSTLGPIDSPDAILTRTNATAIECLLTARTNGIRAHVVNIGAQMLAFAKAAQDLQTQGHTSYGDLAGFTTWAEVTRYAQDDALGEDLQLNVRLIEKFTAATIIAAIEDMPAEADADLTISTAHQSKGREWGTVEIAADFVPQTKPGDEPREPSHDELRLRYVACTRAKVRLDCTVLDAKPESEVAA